VNVPAGRQVSIIQGDRPMLVEFWDFCRPNSIRTLPYVKAWHERYASDGLRIVGVHSPGFEASRDEAAVRAAVSRLGIEYPVLVDSELDVWRETIDVNLTGIFLTCKHGLRALLAQGGGAVVCTCSPTGLFGCAPAYDAYSASKAGVYGLVRVLAADYAPAIRVNGVVPGYTDTPMTSWVTPDEHEALLRTIPMRRAGRADEVAAVMSFLASDEASYTTGAVWAADGGMTAI